MTGDPILRLDKVGKSYRGVDAVAEASFALKAGECAALVGHNGAGKTTLIKMILGLARPSRGQIALFGSRPGGRQARRLGFLPEAIGFQAQMSGLEALTFFARLKSVKIADCPRLLAEVGLTEAARRPIRTYSKGMRQRLGLAQALLGEPELLILDEPTTGLDPDLRRRFYRILDDRRAAGTAILLSSHALSELEAYVDRVLVMNRGRLVADGSMAALRVQTGLPVRIRVLADGEPDALIAARPTDIGVRRLNGRTVELSCPPARKLEVIRWAAAAAPAIQDLQVLPPDLEHIYRHFTNDREAGT